MIKQNVLDVLNLCKSYGNHLVLDDISFSIRENEIVGFIGPNGAGKSTLMKCLCGLIHMDSGNVTICGHDIQSQREKALSHQASLIESPGLFFNMTGYENLEIFASLKNVSKDKLQQMADYTRIGDYLKKPVSSYSLGMKQRLALSIALLSSPQFLMLDEPMNGLDPSGVFELRKELRKMVDEYGMSLLISSHQLNEIEKIADRIIYIENGKIKEVAKQEQTITYQIRVNKIITDHQFRKLSDFLYEFSIQNPNELSVYLRKLEREGVQLLDITNTSDDLENMYTRIYGE
ncbi:ABC transporter ATP-binding protein [Holdemanella sp.]|uniref:ABC transporter ATP-binding protein n=1 Tax=Holdemanella sp. TaxID=1971762 RepID=UPI003079F9A5